MIKICPRILHTFSTIKFPEKYKLAFEISHELRTHNSIKALQNYLAVEKQKIITHGKTQTLELFNQYSLNYNNTDSQFLLFALNFENLNIYEEQLRFCCIAKLVEYSPKMLHKYVITINQAEERLIQNLKDKEFDSVDALNTLLQKTYFIRDQLLDKSLQILFKGDTKKIQTMLSKCVSTILKRMQDISWTKLRKYKPLLSFLCHSQIINNQDIKILTQILVRLSKFQLHLMGYDSVPISIKPIYDKIKEQRGYLDDVLVQQALSNFELLPLELHYSLYQYLLGQVMELAGKMAIYPQKLPLAKMRLSDIEHIRKKYSNKWISFYSCQYFLTKPQCFQFIFHSTFMEKAYQYFFRELLSNHKRANTEFPGILAFAVKLLNYYCFDQSKAQEIAKLTKQIINTLIKSPEYQELMNGLSLCNIINLIMLNREYQLFGNNIVGLLNNTLGRFKGKQKLPTYFKTKGIRQQIQECLAHFANKKDYKLRQIVFQLINSNFTGENTETKCLDEDFRAYIIFQLQNSNNCLYFRPITDRMYLLYKGEWLAFAELYILYTRKTHRLTVRVISKIWEQSHNLVAVAKILAYSEQSAVTNQNHNLEGQIHAILKESATLLTIQSIQQLSLGEIQQLYRFCNHFLHQTEEFTKNLLSCSINRVQNDVVQKGLNFKLLQAFLKLINKLGLRQPIYQNLVHKILKIAQARLTKQQLSLQNYWLFAQSSKYLNINNENISKWDQLVTQKLNDRSLQVSNATIQLSLLLKLLFNNRINLKSEGQAYVKDHIKKGLLSTQIFPIQLKQAVQAEIYNLKHISVQKLYLIKEIFEFCLKDVKIQQGVEFYYWCLRLFHEINGLQIAGLQCSQQMLLVLQLLPLSSIDSDLLNGVLKIMKEYPNIASKSFNSNMANLLKMPNLNLTGSYLPILEYFDTLYYEIPSQFLGIFKHLLPILQPHLLHQWKQFINNPLNTSKSIDNTGIMYILNKSHTYFSVVIKNDMVSPNTFKIFEKCLSTHKTTDEIMRKNPLQSYKQYKMKLISNYLANQTTKSENLQEPQADITPKKSFFKKSTNSTKPKDKSKELKNITYNGLQAFPIFHNSIQITLLQSEFERLNIKKSNVYLEQSDFHSFDFTYQGLKVQYFMKYKGKHYSILAKSEKFKNEEGLIGQIKLLENIYRKLFGVQALYIDPDNIVIETEQVQQKTK